jgi:TonB family protein
MGALLLTVFLLHTAAALQTSTGAISGQLLSREGRPATGIRVSAMVIPDGGVPVSAASALVSSVLTDTSGRYRLENVPPGQYYVTAGFLDSPTYYPGTSALSGATAVRVEAGASVMGISFSLTASAGVSVSGRIVRRPGTPASGTQRVVLSGTPSPVETTANADGTFQFTRVRPGTYNVVVTPSVLLHPVSIVVTDKEVSGVEIVVVPTVEVTGTLEVEGNGPRPRISLSFSPYRGGAGIPGAGLSANGSFRAVLPEGDYRMGWSNLPVGYELRAITSGSTDLLINPLKIVGGESVRPITVALGVGTPLPWSKVSGRFTGLTNLSNMPPGGRFSLSLSGGSGLDPLSVMVSADGSFEFERVLAGTYSPTTSLPIPLPSLVVPYGRDGVTFEFPVPPMKEVAGRVRLEDGTPANVPSINFGLTDVLAMPTSQSRASSRAEMRGSEFKVTVPVGERRMTTSIPGFMVRSVTFGATDLQREPIRVSSTSTEELVIVVASAINPAGVVGGVGGGGVGAVPLPVTFAPTPPVPSAPAPAGTIRIAGDLAERNLISSVTPVDPPLARAARVSGAVLLQIVISRDGNVESITVISGHPLLNDSAIDAVRQRKYKPHVVNGQAVPVITTVSLTFTF